MPIGSSGGAFNGTLDGNGYTIRGLNLDGDGDVGFIADNNGTVRNLFFDDVTVVLTGYEVIGGIIAATNTGTIENCLVSNSSLTMDYTSEDVVATIYAGGIAGLNRGTISMCEMKDSDVNISHTSRDSISYITDEQRLDVQNNMYVGGIAGYSSGVVENCLSNASVSVYTQSLRKDGDYREELLGNPFCTEILRQRLQCDLWLRNYDRLHLLCHEHRVHTADCLQRMGSHHKS